MQLKSSTTFRVANFLLTLLVFAITACSSSSSDSVSSSAPSVLVTHSPNATATSIGMSDGEAERACLAIADDIPLVVVVSGKPALAAAYAVTGEQLARYKSAAFDDGSSIPSQPIADPTDTLAMCLFDGDFATMTPGPPQADRSAERVLVSISDGVPQLESIAKTRSSLPTTNPALLP